jgi:hypothetical protein
MILGLSRPKYRVYFICLLLDSAIIPFNNGLASSIIAFESTGIKMSQFILTLLTCQQFNDHTIVRDLLLHANDIFVAFLKYPTPNSPSASHLMQEIYTAEVCRLASKDSGSHFGALSTTTEQLEQFSVVTGDDP